jgi:hypothetical protein
MLADERDLSRSGQSTKPERQAAFVSRSRVFLDDAPLSSTIDHGESNRQRILGTRCVLMLQEAAHRPNLMTQSRLAHAVDCGSPLRYANALQ